MIIIQVFIINDSINKCFVFDTCGLSRSCETCLWVFSKNITVIGKDNNIVPIALHILQLLFSATIHNLKSYVQHTFCFKLIFTLITYYWICNAVSVVNPNSEKMWPFSHRTRRTILQQIHACPMSIYVQRVRRVDVYLEYSRCTGPWLNAKKYAFVSFKMSTHNILKKFILAESIEM